jgi:alpha/beta superfamily hydrolase
MLETAFRSHIRTIEDLNGPAGRLEAVLNTGLDDAPFAALVCHPHPPSGGTLHHKVVYRAMKTLNGFGLPVLRFNFRGVGHSANHLGKPILLAGFSFGANIGMRAGCGDPRVHGILGLGLPVKAENRNYNYDFLPQCTVPKLFVCGDHDQFAPQDVLEQVLQPAPEPKQIVWVEAADHFFQGTPEAPGSKLDQLQAAITSWLETEFRLVHL